MSLFSIPILDTALLNQVSYRCKDIEKKFKDPSSADFTEHIVVTCQVIMITNNIAIILLPIIITIIIIIIIVITFQANEEWDTEVVDTPCEGGTYELSLKTPNKVFAHLKFTPIPAFACATLPNDVAATHSMALVNNTDIVEIPW